jgi:hypothetical protein
MSRSLASTNASFAAVFLLALALGGTALAQSATVMTDKADYAPGTIVTITGSGWQPGETVTLQFVESPLVDTHPDLTAVADANGNIFNNQFSPDEHDADITFTLTATGGTSGLQAQTTFTDSISSITITSAPFGIAVNSCSAAITMTCGGNNSTISLSSSSAGGKFYASAANCASQTSPITTDGTTCNPPNVFYRDSIAGNPTITVTANGNTDTQTETIFGPATKLVFTNTPVTVTAGVCSSALTVVSQDANGNASTVTSTETLTPSATPPAGATFYTDASCTTAVTGSNLTIATGSNTVDLFFKDTNPGSVVITVTGTGGFTANGANAATQTETVNAAIVRRGQTIVATLSPKNEYVLMAMQ